MDDEDLNGLTKQQLILTVKELLAEVEEKDETIRKLEVLNTELERGTGGKSKNKTEITLQFANYEAEISSLKEKFTKEQATTARIKDQLADVTAKLNVNEVERGTLDADLRRARKNIDDLEQELNEAKESTRVNGRKSAEIFQQKKDTQKQQLQLYEENELLQNENKALQAQLAASATERIELEEVVAKLADERDSLEIQQESVTLMKTELQARIQELEQGEWEGHLEALQTDNIKEIERVTAIAIQSRKEADDLKKQVAELRDST
eukprot:gene5953-12016_t